jgi:hypothetical protein
MMDESLIGKDLGGRSLSLIEATSWSWPGGTEESQETLSQDISQPARSVSLLLVETIPSRLGTLFSNLTPDGAPILITCILGGGGPRSSSGPIHQLYSPYISWFSSVPRKQFRNSTTTASSLYILAHCIRPRHILSKINKLNSSLPRSLTY